MKFFGKLALALLPVAAWLCFFIAFEPNDYFGLRGEGSLNAPVSRIRAYENDMTDNVILGDSRMAHFDMELVEEVSGEAWSNVSYGGASLDESIDEFYYLYELNPDIQNVVFGVSFYTLNNNYRTVNRMATVKTQLENPAAYLFNLEYNINALTVFKDEVLLGLPDVEETAEHTPDEYVDENGGALPFRSDLIDYAENSLAPVCENYAVNEAALERLLELAAFCEEHGVNFTVVFPPMDESVRVLVAQPNGIDGTMAGVLARLADAGVRVLDYEWENDPGYPDTAYYDGFHLDTVHGLPEWTKTLFTEVYDGT